MSPGSPTNFMVLTRATTTPGADGVYGHRRRRPPAQHDDVRSSTRTRPIARTPSHQVFLRQYALTRRTAQGDRQLIEGANGGMANWGELKALRQHDARHPADRPRCRQGAAAAHRPYGNFIPGANGFPQVITGIGADGIPNTADDIVIEGDPAPMAARAISIDIGDPHDQRRSLPTSRTMPCPTALADGDIEIGLDNRGATTPASTTMNCSIAHFIAGDGRVNENIGLTAVHHIFHAEHNRLVEHTKEVVLADAQAMLADGATQAQAVASSTNGWRRRCDRAGHAAAIEALVWDGERLFQAAKFGTEMQYQHLVFEEFARKIQPSIDVFLSPDGYRRRRSIRRSSPSSRTSSIASATRC